MLYQYLMDQSIREHPAQVALRAAPASHRYAGMQIAPDPGQFMALRVKLLEVRRAIEVGVFTGYSALTVALAMPDDGAPFYRHSTSRETGTNGRDLAVNHHRH